jgi:putative aldouronate transport system substrate-binding protein
MRTRWRYATALLGAGALALTGCSGQSRADVEALTIMAPYFSPTAPEADSEVERELSDLAGVEIDMQWAPNAEYGSQTNVVLAGDEVPDVMVVQSKTQGFIQTAEAGGFWDLTEYLESGDYPNLVAADPQVQEAASVNGKVYGIYRARDLVRFCVILRADWLANLGLEAPTTTDELMEVARAFSEDDPDGNGADDTFGIDQIVWPGVGVGSPLDATDIWFGAGNVWKDEGGELVPSWLTPEWRDSLDYSREMFAQGLLNPDFPTKSGEEQHQSFINGEAGIMIGVSSWTGDLLRLLKETDPEHAEDYIAIAAQPSSPNGDFAMPTAGYSGFLSISKASIQTEEQLEQVLTALDAMNSPEGQRLLNNGVEGENYTVEDGLAVYDDAQAELTEQVQQAWMQVSAATAGVEYYQPKPATEYEAGLLAQRTEFAAADLETAVFNPAAGLVSETYLTNATMLDQIISDARMQYIAGEIDAAGLDAAVDQWRSSGGDQVIAEFNELYDPAG